MRYTLEVIREIGFRFGVPLFDCNINTEPGQTQRLHDNVVLDCGVHKRIFWNTCITEQKGVRMR